MSENNLDEPANESDDSNSNFANDDELDEMDAMAEEAAKLNKQISEDNLEKLKGVDRLESTHNFDDDSDDPDKSAKDDKDDSDASGSDGSDSGDEEEERRPQIESQRSLLQAAHLLEDLKTQERRKTYGMMTSGPSGRGLGVPGGMPGQRPPMGNAYSAGYRQPANTVVQLGPRHQPMQSISEMGHPPQMVATASMRSVGSAGSAGGATQFSGSGDESQAAQQAPLPGAAPPPGGQTDEKQQQQQQTPQQQQQQQQHWKNLSATDSVLSGMNVFDAIQSPHGEQVENKEEPSKTETDDETGLFTSESLPAKLDGCIENKQFSHNCILALMKIDNVEQIYGELGTMGWPYKINQVGQNVNEWCRKRMNWLPFRFDTEEKIVETRGMFAVIINGKHGCECYKVTELIYELMKSSETSSSVSFSIGLTYLSENDKTSKEVIDRCWNCLNRARGAESNDSKESQFVNKFYFDYLDSPFYFYKHLKHAWRNTQKPPEEAPLKPDDESNKNKRKKGKYVLGMIEVDNVNVAQDEAQARVQAEAIKNVFVSNGDGSNGYIFSGYSLTDGGLRSFAVILYDEGTGANGNISKFNELISKVTELNQVSVSVGYTECRKNETVEKWLDRGEKHLKMAQMSGKNKSYPKKRESSEPAKEVCVAIIRFETVLKLIDWTKLDDLLSLFALEYDVSSYSNYECEYQNVLKIEFDVSNETTVTKVDYIKSMMEALTTTVIQYYHVRPNELNLSIGVTDGNEQHNLDQAFTNMKRATASGSNRYYYDCVQKIMSPTSIKSFSTKLTKSLRSQAKEPKDSKSSESSSDTNDSDESGSWTMAKIGVKGAQNPNFFEQVRHHLGVYGNAFVCELEGFEVVCGQDELDETDSRTRNLSIGIAMDGDDTDVKGTYLLIHDKTGSRMGKGVLNFIAQQVGSSCIGYSMITNRDMDLENDFNQSSYSAYSNSNFNVKINFLACLRRVTECLENGLKKGVQVYTSDVSDEVLDASLSGLVESVIPFEYCYNKVKSVIARQEWNAGMKELFASDACAQPSERHKKGWENELYISESERTQLANEIKQIMSEKKEFEGNELLLKQIKILSLSDEALVMLSEKFEFHKDYFERLYAYLKCQQFEISNLLLKNKKDYDEEVVNFLTLAQLYNEDTIKTLVFLNLNSMTIFAYAIFARFEKAVGTNVTQLFGSKKNNKNAGAGVNGIGARAIEIATKKPYQLTEDDEKDLQTAQTDMKANHLIQSKLLQSIPYQVADAVSKNEIEVNNSISDDVVDIVPNASEIINDVNEKIQQLFQIYMSAPDEEISSLMNQLNSASDESNPFSSDFDPNQGSSSDNKNANNIDTETGLYTSKTLTKKIDNYVVNKQFGNSCILALLKIDNLEQSPSQINHVGQIVNDLCHNEMNWMPFRFDSNQADDTRGMFAIIISGKNSCVCYKVTQTIYEMMKNIANLTKLTLCVGLTYLNESDQTKSLIDRSLTCLNTAQGSESSPNTNKLNFDYLDTSNNFSNHLKRARQMSSNANLTSTLALIALDNGGQDDVTAQFETFQNELMSSGDATNKFILNGYNLTDGNGTKLGLIVMEETDTSRGLETQVVHDKFDALVAKINELSPMTISIGYSECAADDTVATWQNKCEENLRIAKENGVNARYPEKPNVEKEDEEVKEDKDEMELQEAKSQTDAKNEESENVTDLEVAQGANEATDEAADAAAGMVQREELKALLAENNEILLGRFEQVAMKMNEENLVLKQEMESLKQLVQAKFENTNESNQDIGQNTGLEDAGLVTEELAALKQNVEYLKEMMNTTNENINNISSNVNNNEANANNGFEENKMREILSESNRTIIEDNATLKQEFEKLKQTVLVELAESKSDPKQDKKASKETEILSEINKLSDAVSDLTSKVEQMQATQMSSGYEAFSGAVGPNDRNYHDRNALLRDHDQSQGCCFFGRRR